MVSTLDTAMPATPAPSGITPQATGVSLDLFFAQVLTMIGAPVTQNNIDNMKAWASAENSANFVNGGYTGPAWNPLNIEHSYNGSSPWGPAMAKGAPVQQYGSATDGATATAMEMNTWIPAFAPITAALKADVPCQNFGHVVTATGWGTEPFNACTGSSVPTVQLGNVTATEVSAWSTIGGAAGAALKLLPGVGGLPGALAGGASSVGSAAGDLATLGTILSDISSAAWWKRVGIFTLGGAMLGIGLVVFFASTPTGQKITSDATEVAGAAALA